MEMPERIEVIFEETHQLATAIGAVEIVEELNRLKSSDRETRIDSYNQLESSINWRFLDYRDPVSHLRSIAIHIAAAILSESSEGYNMHCEGAECPLQTYRQKHATV